MKRPTRGWIGFFTVLLVVAYCSMQFWQRGRCKIVIAFLPPVALSKTRPESLSNWSSPRELARSLLEGPELTGVISSDLDKAGEKKAAQEFFHLQTDQRLQLVSSGDRLLEISFPEKDPQRAVLYGQALLAYLKRELRQQKEARQIDSTLLADQTQGLERLRELELQVIRSGLETTSNASEVRIHFALNHYRESWQGYRRAVEQQTRWKRQVEEQSPTFVVLSGPQFSRETTFLQ